MKFDLINEGLLKEHVDWDYFDKYSPIINEYMPDQGEGDTMASQIATAVNKLIYKWYNDGDVFDNTYYLTGWANDLSSYANWLHTNIPEAKYSLDEIKNAQSEDDYELILKNLADHLLDKYFLADYAKKDKIGSIYNANGPFMFRDPDGDEDEDDYYDESLNSEKDSKGVDLDEALGLSEDLTQAKVELTKQGVETASLTEENTPDNTLYGWELLDEFDEILDKENPMFKSEKEAEDNAIREIDIYNTVLKKHPEYTFKITSTANKNLDESIHPKMDFDHEAHYTIYKIIADRDFTLDDLEENELEVYGSSENIDGAIDLLNELNIETGEDGVIFDNETDEFIEQQEIDNYMLHRAEMEDQFSDYYTDGNLDEKLIKKSISEAKKKRLMREIRSIAKDDLEVGHTQDPDDFDEFAHIMIDDNPELGYYDEDEEEVIITDETTMHELWDYYWECLDELRDTLYESIDNPYSSKLSPSERSTAIKLAKEGINKLDPEKEYSEQELFNAMDPENNYDEEEYFWYAMYYLLDKGSLIYINGKYKKANLDEKLIQSPSKNTRATKLSLIRKINKKFRELDPDLWHYESPDSDEYNFHFYDKDTFDQAIQFLIDLGFKINNYNTVDEDYNVYARWRDNDPASHWNSWGSISIWNFDGLLDENLIQGKSNKTLQKNIETEIKAGKDPKQAAAIAYSIQRKHED